MTDSHQYVDNNSTNRRKSVKQMSRNLYSETAKTCTLRCDYCGRYTKDSDLTAEFTEDDLEAVYRYQNGVYAGDQSDRVTVYQKVRCTVRKN